MRPNLPREVQNLVNRALSRNPTERHPKMTVLKENILACLAAAEGAPAPVRLPATGLTTPAFPTAAGQTDRTLHAQLRRVQVRPSVIVAAAALGAIALLTLRYTRDTSFAEAAHTPPAHLEPAAPAPAAGPASIAPAPPLPAPPQANARLVQADVPRLEPCHAHAG